MATWFRNVRTGSFRRSTKLRPPSPALGELIDADSCSVIQNVNVVALEQRAVRVAPARRAASLERRPCDHTQPGYYISSRHLCIGMDGSVGSSEAVGFMDSHNTNDGISGSSSSRGRQASNGHVTNLSRVTGTSTGTTGASNLDVGSALGQRSGSISMPAAQEKCERHPVSGNCVPYYCLQCSLLACQSCLDEGIHYGHDLRLVVEAAEERHRNLQDRVSELAHRLDGLKIRQDQMDTFEQSYRDSRKLIQDTAKELILRIKEHEERLLKEASDIHETNYKKYGVTKDELDQNVLTLDILQRRAQGVADNMTMVKDNPIQFLQCHKNIVEKLTSFEHLFPSEDPKTPVMSFNPIRCNTSFGIIETTDQQTPLRVRKKRVSIQPRSISLPSSPQPGTGKKTVAFGRTYEQSQSCTAGSPPATSVGHTNRNNVILNARDYSVLIHGGSNPGSPTSTGPVCSTPVVRTTVLLDDLTKHAKCLWKLTQEGSGPGEISCPNDASFLFDGSVVVADRDNHRIQIFDSQGNFVKQIAAAKFRPRRICITSNGNIAVTDASESCVKVFDLSGQCIISWGKKWYKNIFKSPCGIAVNSLQQPIVSDMERHTVTIFTMEGKLVRHLQCEGNQDFHSPAYICTDTQDRIIVADNWQQCVKVFDETGKFLFQFYKTGSDDNYLEYPNGVCADNQDNIYVADWGTHTVSKFTKDGVFLRHVLTREDGLYRPAGIATMDNYLAVTAYCDSQSSVALYAM